MDENYWKDAYRNTWDASSQREKNLMRYLERMAGVQCIESGLGAGSSQYISGSAARNGYQKGDADFSIKDTNIYIEVTGPLVKSVKPSDPLWFRPDKLENAIRNREHDVFLAHHCMSADLWRIIHIDEEFKRRFNTGEFRVVTPFIRGRRERYAEIEADDRCLCDLNYLVTYLKNKRALR